MRHHAGMKFARIVVAAATALLVGAVARAAEDEVSATPFRPTVTSGAALSAPGWLELELGGQRLGGNDQERRNSLPYLLKYSINERLALLLGGDAQLAVPGLHWRGDTLLTIKARAPDPADGVSLGLEATLKLPTAAVDLGSGKRDESLKGIVGIDLPEGFHLDSNLLITRLGAISPGQGRTQLAWAAALSHPLGDAWTLAGDLSGTRQSGAPSTAQFLAAASFAASKRLVLDGGMAAGLNHDTPKWTVFAGLTVLLGRLN
ncbi:hypothetical protein BH11PSE10_BH11PSE10_08560 [soil metagenome]